MADNQHILEEKRKELDEIVSETRMEEENIRVKAKELEQKIDDYTLAAFKRIRKMLATGLASSLCREVPAEAASTAFPRNASLK